jgi:hypothetical protein
VLRKKLGGQGPVQEKSQCGASSPCPLQCPVAVHSTWSSAIQGGLSELRFQSSRGALSDQHD